MSRYRLRSFRGTLLPAFLQPAIFLRTAPRRTILQRAVLLPALLLMLSCGSMGGGSHQTKDDLNAAFSAARRGYWQEALLRYQTADRVQPDQPEVLNNLAVALEAVGRYEEARETYERARELAPGDRHIDRNYKRFQEFFDSYIAEPTAEVEQDPSSQDASAQEAGEQREEDKQ